MELLVVLDIVRFGLGVAFLLAASAQDLRTRRVDDRLWLMMGAAGLSILAIQVVSVERLELAHLLLLPLPAVLFLDVFWEREVIYDRETGKLGLPGLAAYLGALGLLGLGLHLVGFHEWTFRLLLVPGLILFAYLLYFTGALHGGADAKAFMSISMLAPFYPAFLGFPAMDVSSLMDVAFPFAMTVLLDSALFMLAIPVSLLFYNLARGDAKMPLAFLGYRRPLDGLEGSFVWPMQDVRDGRVVYVLRPRRGGDEAVVQRLRAAGLENVWVTPKVPFMLPLTAGFVFSALVGNILYLALGLSI